MNDESTLRLVLKLDAVASAGLGAVGAIGGSLLDSTLGLPAALLHGLGAFLLVWAAFVWWVGTRPAVPRLGVIAVVEGNAVWSAASIALVALDWFTPTTAGAAIALAQAAAVAALAALQARYGLRASTAVSGLSENRPSTPSS
jgi:hypothetical protein